MVKKPFLAAVILGVIVLSGLEIPALAQHGGTPSVLTVRQQADLVHKITAKRLDTLLPRMMREAGLDMWIISCNEDNLDPIFETMVPFGNWNPITQILVFYDQGPAKGVERLVRNDLWRGRTPAHFYDSIQWLYGWNVSNCLDAGLRELDLAPAAVV